MRPQDPPGRDRLRHRRRSTAFLFAGTFLVITVAGPPAAATTLQIHPSDDAYVEDRYPGTNFGNSGSVYVGDENYNDPAATCRTYAKYDLSGIPAGATIHSAAMYFRTWGIGPSPDIVVTAHSLGTDAWNEGTITWNNAPTGWGAVSDTKTVNATSTWYGWDVSFAVAVEYLGDGTFSGVLKATSEGVAHSWCGFGSMEQGFGFDPYLEVEYTAGPTLGFSLDQSLLGVWKSDASWADFDGDGDIDLAICGESDSGTVTRTYENQSGTLVAFQDLVGVQAEASGALAWGDYDLDGDLDLALAGTADTGHVARVYENDGTGHLTWDAAQSLVPVSNPSLAWGDVDNDGDLELYLAGHDGASPVAVLYENDPPGTLAPDTVSTLTGLTSGSADFADWNGDGWPELVVTGSDGTNRRTLFYRNSAGSLIHDGDHGLPGLALSDAAWGDYDNDGDLDLAITGESGVALKVARVYGNDGAGNFVPVVDVATIYRSSCAWGDYDNDGDLDVAFCGYTGGSLQTGIYENAAGVFTPTSFSFPSVREGSLNWVDADDDGDLDFFLTGADWSSKYAQLYESTGASANTAPTAPTSTSGSQSVSAFGVAGPLTLDWSGAADTETPAAGLYYCLRVGTSSGADDVVSGTYATPLMGNAGQAPSAELRVPGRTYYWSVRAIDSGLRASAWSAEQVCVPDTVGFATIHPSDDAYVDSTQPGTPCGAADPTNLYVGDMWGSGAVMRSYLKFQLAGIPSNATITLAELHVFRYGGSPAPYWVDAWEEGIDNWNALTVTWSNAPTMFAPQASSTVEVSPAGECVWDVTSDVAAQLVVDGVLTEVLRGGAPPEGTPLVLAEFHADETAFTPQRPFLKVWWTTPATGAPDTARLAAGSTRLEQNAPNPFRPSTAIAFTLGRPGPVKLDVVDVRGRLVRRLAEGTRPAGRHRIVWDGRDESGRRAAAGVYFCRLAADGTTESRRMVRLR